MNILEQNEPYASKVEISNFEARFIVVQNYNSEEDSDFF